MKNIMSEVCFITLKPQNQPKHKTSEEGGKMVKVMYNRIHWITLILFKISLLEIS